MSDYLAVYRNKNRNPINEHVFRGVTIHEAEAHALKRARSVENMTGWSVYDIKLFHMEHASTLAV